MDILQQHVTVREYSSKPIPDELIRSILTSGIRASTTGNIQAYSVVVTKNKERILKMAPLHFNQAAARNASVIITFCADFNRFTKWCRQREADPGFDNFLSFFTAAIDAILVAQNVCIAAENAGLGICYLGTVTYNADELIDFLHLPELVVPVSSIAVGWPLVELPLTDRLPLEAVIHDEVYVDYDEMTIHHLYRQKEALESSRRFVSENGKNSLAQVFTDVRYPKKENEFFSGKFLKTLVRQGFLSDSVAVL